MMTVTQSDVRRLIDHRGQPCVSVYMSTDPVWPGGPSDRARLRRLLRDAARRLAQVHPLEAIEGLLTPVAERVRESWPPRGRGLALLRSPDLNLGFELPVEVPSLAVVAPTFHTKPLLSLLDRARHFYVLALDGWSVRLFEGSAAGLVDVTSRAIPADLREQAHGEEAHRGSRQRWFAALDRAISDYLGTAKAPIVLAGLRAEQALYRSVSADARVLQDGVDGLVHGLPGPELHDRAWALVCVEEATAEGRAADLYRAFLQAGQATDALAEVIAAAAEGRVRLLLHRRGAHLWGRMEPGTAGAFRLRTTQAQVQLGDSDLIDDLCERTLREDGEVVELAPERMPSEAPVAAILRY